MKLLTKDQIKAVDDRKFETLSVPEWGGAVRIASVTGKQRGQLEARFTAADAAKKDPASFRACVLALCMVDEDFKPLFAIDDIDDLMAKNAGVVEPLFECACKLNGFTKKDVEELEKNSASGPSAASGSTSVTATPPPSASFKKSLPPATSPS